MYVCNHENNLPSRLSPQWLCGISCNSTHAHLVSVRFEHSMCRGSLMTTYMKIYCMFSIFNKGYI